MENLIDLISSLSKNTTPTEKQNNNIIPKEILDQYPYGEFPIRYTKTGQDTIRKNSENRFSYSDIPEDHQHTEKTNNSLDIKALLPLIQTLSNKNNSPQTMFKLLSELLLKDNPELSNLIKLLPNSKEQANKIFTQEINNTSTFPNTNKIDISTLQKVNK